ncbi:MAG: AAA family ATPase, partial [Collinsella sp.]
LDEAESPEVTRFLRAVDVRIDGFRVEKAPEWRGQRVFVRHEVDGKGYELRLSEESAGTQKLMGLAAYLMTALERGATVVVDELDAKLHPKLLRYVILLGSWGQQRCARLIFVLTSNAKRRVPPRRDGFAARRGEPTVVARRHPRG